MLDRRFSQFVATEPTLSNTLRAVAEAHFPSQFYQVLQLAIPTAFELWSLGWYRSAAAMCAVSAFGVWALCEQRRTAGEPPARSDVWFGGIRRVAGTIAALTAVGIALDTFVRFMGVVFRCPGCAG